MNEDKSTSTPEGAGAYERHRAQERGEDQVERPDPSEYLGDAPAAPQRSYPDVQAVTDPFSPGTGEPVMDPDRSLDRLRELVVMNRNGMPVDVDEVIEHIDFLDRWLAAGGRPPQQWTVNR